MSLLRILRASLGCAAGLALAGCMSAPSGSAIPEPRPLGADYEAPARSDEDRSDRSRPAPTEPSGALRLNQALELALLQNPELTAFSYDVRAAEALVLQAGLPQNPQLELEIEEYDRNGQGFDSAEGTLALAQIIQLGGKRRWRARVAEAAGELAGWDYESKRLDVFTATSGRFVEVVAAQRRLDLMRSMVGLAEETSRAVTERVNAGREPRLQASKAEAELEVARIAVVQAGNELDVARRKLAAMWGADQPRFEKADGDLDAVPESVPDRGGVEALLPRNPDLARWDTEIRLRHAALSSAKAGRVPDVKAAVGYQQYQEDDSNALAFGIGVPLPLFDRNQGNVAAEQQRLRRAEAKRRAVATTLNAELAATYAELASAHNRVLALRSKVVPSMKDAFEAAQEGYRQGKFGFLDMLDAQRGLFEAQGALLDALASYHRAVNAMERMTGTGMKDLTEFEHGEHP